MAGEKNFSGNGLLEWLNTPQGMGLLSGVATYAASARRGTPVNNIGRGLAGGLMGYGQAKDAIAQEQENQILRQYRRAQLDKMRAETEREQATKSWQSGLPGMMKQAKTQVTPFEADNPFGEDLGKLATVQQGNPQALQEYLMRPESPYAGKLIEQQLLPESVIVGRTLKNKHTGETLGYDETWKEEQEALRAQRMDELKMRLQDQQLSREQANALRREIAAQTSAYQRESLELRRDAANAKTSELEDKRVKGKELSIAQAKSVLDEIKDAKKLVGLTTSGVGGVLRNIPMTDARDLDAKLTSIKANLGFDRLQQMRDASPTGGALGQVAVQELVALQATIASLDQLQSPSQLKQALDKIERHYSNWQKTLSGGEQPRDRRATDKSPSGVDPKVWKHMTPEERKLWQN